MSWPPNPIVTENESLIDETDITPAAIPARNVSEAMYSMIGEVIAMTSSDTQQATKAMAAIRRILAGEVLSHHPPAGTPAQNSNVRSY